MRDSIRHNIAEHSISSTLRNGQVMKLIRCLLTKKDFKITNRFVEIQRHRQNFAIRCTKKKELNAGVNISKHVKSKTRRIEAMVVIYSQHLLWILIHIWRTTLTEKFRSSCNLCMREHSMFCRWERACCGSSCCGPKWEIASGKVRDKSRRLPQLCLGAGVRLFLLKG